MLRNCQLDATCAYALLFLPMHVVFMHCCSSDVASVLSHAIYPERTRLHPCFVNLYRISHVYSCSCILCCLCVVMNTLFFTTKVYSAPRPKWTQLAHRRLQNWGQYFMEWLQYVCCCFAVAISICWLYMMESPLRFEATIADSSAESAWLEWVWLTLCQPVTANTIMASHKPIRTIYGVN